MTENSPKTFGSFVREERKSLVIVLVSVFAFLLLEFYGWFSSVEGHAFDQWIKSLKKEEVQLPVNAEALKKMPLPVDVVEINDEVYQDCFNSQSPLDPELVQHWVNALKGLATVVVVDLITDDKRYRGFSAGDKVVWAAPDETRYAEPEKFSEWLASSATRRVSPGVILGGTEDKNIPWGVPAFPIEEDGRIRRVERYFVSPAGESIPSLAVQAADAYPSKKLLKDEQWKESFLDGRVPPPRLVPATEVFEVPNVPGLPGQCMSLRKDAQVLHPIVVLGGTYGSARDTFQTPWGQKSGAEVNAMAIEAELLSNQLREPPKYLMVALDILIGIGMVRFFWRKNYRVQTFFAVSVVAVVLGYAIASFFFFRYVGWVSWVGPLLGAIAGFVIDLIRKNPMLTHDEPRGESITVQSRTEIRVTSS